MRDIWKCSNPMHEDKPWMLKYLLSSMDTNTPEGKKALRSMARKLFLAIGIIVALSFVLWKIL